MAGVMNCALIVAKAANKTISYVERGEIPFSIVQQYYLALAKQLDCKKKYKSGKRADLSNFVQIEF